MRTHVKLESLLAAWIFTAISAFLTIAIVCLGTKNWTQYPLSQTDSKTILTLLGLGTFLHFIFYDILFPGGRDFSFITAGPPRSNQAVSHVVQLDGLVLPNLFQNFCHCISACGTRPCHPLLQWWSTTIAPKLSEHLVISSLDPTYQM